ncbi:MAG: SurA N-terminal domain-containing protein [Kiritimatiellae bacterium]|nr:SurA N-terminal domain-containing protein [Kiritimatiellia bacterium]
MMFISKFNKLIRNKILWGGFAGIVVLSFVVWGTQTGGSGAEEETVGKLYGKQVPPAQFRKAYFNTYLSMSLMLGRPLQITDKLNDLMRKLAWRRMVVLRAADELGLAAPADEVAGTIAQQPFFNDNGRFSPEKYQAFAQTFLARLGASQAQFEGQVREELLINKARMLLAQTVWVAPLEIAQAFSQVYDIFQVSYAVINADDLRHRIKISDADAREYFAARREEFKLPEMARVKYAEFSFSRFVDEKSLTEETLRGYYDENIEKFSVKTTNGWSDPVPFAEAEGQIRALLAQENAVETAGDKALDFEVALAPDRAGNAPSFEEAAKAAGVTVRTSTFFSAESVVPGLEAGIDFNQAAFNLRPTPDEYFSHPIKGSNAYYIVAFDQRSDPRIPEYREVKEAVFQAALEEAARNMLNETARYLRDAAGQALKEGKTFTAALAPFGAEVIRPEPFSARSGFPVDDDDEDLAYALTKNILPLSAGELSEVIPLTNGAAIVYVESRRPESHAVFQSIRNDLGLFIQRRRVETAFYEWQEYLLKEAGFEDYAARKRTESPPEDEQEPDEDDVAP